VTAYRILPAITSAAVLGLAVGTAQAGLFIVGDDKRLYEIESESGPVTDIGATGISGSSLTALTLDNSGTLYTTNGSTLYTLDKATGVGTEVGAGGMGISGVEGIAVSAGGTMYAASGDDIYTVDLGTGNATSVGTTVGSNGWDDLLFTTQEITYNGNTLAAGTLLGLDATFGIYEINTSTFAITLIDAVAVDIADEAFAMDGDGGLISSNYNRAAPGGGDDGSAAGFYELDLSGGGSHSYVLNGPAGVGINGMAMDTDNQIPLPAPLLLMGLGAALLLRQRA